MHCFRENSPHFFLGLMPKRKVIGLEGSCMLSCGNLNFSLEQAEFTYASVLGPEVFLINGQLLGLFFSHLR